MRVTGQELSVVSDVKGTTTDPVMKAMELLAPGAGPASSTRRVSTTRGALGELRVRKTRQILNRTDVAVLVVDITADITEGGERARRYYSPKKRSPT